MRLIIVTIISFVLVACATDEDYRKTLSTWLNSSEQELVSAWGIPTSYYESGGVRYLTYSSGRNVTIPGTPPSYQLNSFGTLTPIGGTSPTNIYLNCRTTFSVFDGKVKGYNFDGSDCR